MRVTIILLAVIIVLTGNAFAASSSASYKITTETINMGGGSATSTSYKVIGKIEIKQLMLPSSTSFIIGEGFLKSAYFSVPTPILAPLVTSVTPNTGVNTGSVNITNLAGANFIIGATVKLTKSGQSDLIASNVVVVSASQITCTFDLTGKVGGLWDLTVTNADGKSGTLPSAFTITYPAPTVTAITPGKGDNNAVVSITNLAGTNFRSGAVVKLLKTGETDIAGENVSVASSTEIACQFNLTGKTIGAWDVVVVNDDNRSATLPQGFKIESPTIQIIGPVQNTEMPFNPAVRATSIKYTLSKETNIIVDIFNMRGEKVWERAFTAGESGAAVGLNSVAWDGLSDFRAIASFGVYIVIISTKENGSVKELGRTKIAVVK